MGYCLLEAQRSKLLGMLDFIVKIICICHLQIFVIEILLFQPHKAFQPTAKRLLQKEETLYGSILLAFELLFQLPSSENKNECKEEKVLLLQK